MHKTQFLLILLFSMVKTLFAPPAGFAFGMTFWEVLLAVGIGGVFGFVAFFFLSDYLLKLSKKKSHQKGRKNSFQKARRLIRMKKKYKLGAFLFVLPFFSIPVMAFVIRRFYGHSMKVFLISILIIVFWSVVSTLFFSPIGLISA